MQSVSVDDGSGGSGQTSEEVALKKQNLVQEVMKFVPMLLRLPQETRAQLSREIEIKAYSAETIIFHVGQEDSGFVYFVLSGTVGVFRETEPVAGLNVPMVKRGKGDMLGEIELLEDRARQVTAKVLTESRLILISRETVFRHQDLLDVVRHFHGLVARTEFWGRLT